MISLVDLRKVLKFKRQAGKEAVFLCPFCKRKGYGVDIRGHLYINLVGGFYMCHRCHEKGNSYDLYKNFGIRNSGLNINTSIIRDKFHSKKLFMRNKLVKQISEDFMPVEKDSEHYNYLVKRGLSDKQIRYYGWGTMEKQPTYVFVPLIFNNKLFGYQGRTIVSEQKPKYLNYPSSIPKSQIFFNWDTAKYYKTVYIVEGVFDSMAIGFNCIAALFNRLSKTQQRLLTESNIERIIMALDRDSEDKSNEEALQLYDYIPQTGWLSWNGTIDVKDVDELNFKYGHVELQKYIHKGVRWHEKPCTPTK